MGSCCGGNSEAVLAAKIAIGLIPNPSPEEIDSPQSPDVVRLEFATDQRGSQTFGGRGITPTGRVYKGGNNPFDKYINADPRDAEWLIGSGYWRRVAREGTPVTPVDMAAVTQVIERMASVDEFMAKKPTVAETPNDVVIAATGPGANWTETFTEEIPEDGLVIPDHPKPKRKRTPKVEDAA